MRVRLPRRRRLALGLALAVLVGAGLALRATLRAAPSAAATAEPPCRVTHERDVAPLQREIGQQVTVSLEVELICDPRGRPLDLVLVLDASPGIRRSSLLGLKLSLERSLARIAPSPGEGLRIAILAYDDRGLLDGDIQLSDEPEAIRRALRRVEPSDRPCSSVPSNCGAAAALRRAAELLDDDGQPSSRRVVLLATAGIGPRPADPDYSWQLACNELGQAAGNLRSRRDGTVLVTACASDETGFCRSRCLTGKSSDDERFALLSETVSWSPLELGLPELADGTGDFHPVDRIEVVDQLPPALVYEGGDPPGAVDGRRLIWTGYPLTGTWSLSLSYVLGLRNCGQVPSSQDANYTLTYLGPMWGGVIQSASLAMPVIDVACERLPSATPGPTVGPSPSPTPRATTSTPTPSASPTEGRPPSGRLFLPYLSQAACGGERSSQPRDWVLALDVSGSMAGPAGPPFAGLSRWSAARQVGRALLESMRPGVDRVALLQFGEAHEIVQSPGGLSPCCAAALAELADDPRRMRNGHPWAALARARLLLESAPAVGGARRPGIVFLTDLRAGDLGAREDALMMGLAGEARAAGIDVYAVALGEVTEPEFLARWTGWPGHCLDGRRLSLPLSSAVGGWLRCLP